MRLLISAARCDARESRSLSDIQGVRHSIIEFCLEILHFTPRILTPPEVKEALNQIQAPSFPAVLQGSKCLPIGPSGSYWLPGLFKGLNAFGKAVALTKSSGDVELTAALTSYAEKLQASLVLALSAELNRSRPDTAVSQLSRDEDGFEAKYLELGCVSPIDLSFAALRNRLRTIDAMPVRGHHKLLTTMADQLWNKADNIAASARSSVYLSEILFAAHECHLLYSKIVMLLRMAMSRCVEAGFEIPDDLHKEHGVAEELRVSMAETVMYCGNNFYFTYIGFSFAALALSRNTSDIPASTVVADAVARSPLFPKVLENEMKSWAKNCPTFHGDRMLKAFERMFLECFFDKPVAAISRDIYFRGATYKGELDTCASHGALGSLDLWIGRTSETLESKKGGVKWISDVDLLRSPDLAKAYWTVVDNSYLLSEKFEQRGDIENALKVLNLYLACAKDHVRECARYAIAEEAKARLMQKLK